jgi:hypothetical protein
VSLLGMAAPTLLGGRPTHARFLRRGAGWPSVRRLSPSDAAPRTPKDGVTVCHGAR